MAKVIITEDLKKEIFRIFKSQSIKIFFLMKELEKHPKKGKIIGSVAGIVIKELKYLNYRFYFITDGHILKFGTENDLANLLIRLVRISDKKDQQKIIDEIKNILKKFGIDLQ